LADDSPLPRVGRVSAVDGTVALRPAGGEWTDSGINHPVAAGMSVRTAFQGRAELRVGAEIIALAAATELEVAQLDAGGTQLVLRQGRIGVRLSPRTAALAGVPGVDPARSIEIDIPRGGVWLLTPGDYDITTGDERIPARIAVLDGRARFVGKGLDTAIATGSANILSGSDPVAAGLDAAAADDFVAWWRSAAGQDADPPALRYVSAEMTGYEALDGNGSWETVAGYGAVWFPQTAADDWAPYRNGHWRWIAPWGWSWIDDMQWGFAPSHYGRWARIPQSDPLDPSDAGSERWGWVPGRLVAHPVYVPAAVAFLGTAGVGISYPDAVGPAVAWFPLAPGEAYWPGYTTDIDMIRRINDGAVPDFSAIGGGGPETAASAPSDQVRGLKAYGRPATEPPAGIVNGDYRNRRDARIVPRAVFTAGRPVASSLLQLPERRLDNAPLLAGSPQIAPAAPHAAIVASVPAASRRLAGAMRTLARILAPGGRASTAVAATLARPADARAATLALARHSRWPGAHLARPRLLAAAAPRGAHPRLHFAAAHRATLR